MASPQWAAMQTLVRLQQLKPLSNVTEADPLLGGFLTGDYFEVFGHDGTASDPQRRQRSRLGAPPRPTEGQAPDGTNAGEGWSSY